jgi:Zn-finger protein
MLCICSSTRVSVSGFENEHVLYRQINWLIFMKLNCEYYTIWRPLVSGSQTFFIGICYCPLVVLNK